MVHYVEEFYNRMVTKKRIDVLVVKQYKQPSKNSKDLHLIDINNICSKEVRKIGAEALRCPEIQIRTLCKMKIRSAQIRTRKQPIH